MGVGIAAASTALYAIEDHLRTTAMFEALDAKKDATNAHIKELARLAEEVRGQAQEERSDRVREADKEFAALQVAMIEGGGLGTTSALRLGGEIGANEGRDIARITNTEEAATSALESEAKKAVAEFKEAKAATKLGVRISHLNAAQSSLAAWGSVGMNIQKSGTTQANTSGTSTSG